MSSKFHGNQLHSELLIDSIISPQNLTIPHPGTEYVIAQNPDTQVAVLQLVSLPHQLSFLFLDYLQPHSPEISSV